ncbi:histidine kinase N-terminal 7TM domain-containing protein [Halorhabdus sp. CUG00001]|uniref:histidine kinase N-terminal 7TM domain-containing protein n=1 Tax=Halorhabdus sp. CUG00001 TaxID=2600297 RepID=UPI00131BEBFF|nr:histidine kinase N-terminal 7TM domain-containing protein [Halorhabdus sp. CUG00001]
MQELRIIVALAAASISLLLAIYTFVVRWHRRPSKTLAAFGVLMLGTTGWALTAGLGYIAPTADGMRLWLHLEQVAIVLVPSAWFALAVSYTGRENWLTRETVTLLAVEPIMTLLVTASNRWHGLMWAETTVATAMDGTVSLEYTFGLYHYLHLAYSYTLVLASIGLFLWMVLTSDRLYRRQSVALTIGVLAPLATNIFAGSGQPWDVLFTMPTGLTIAGLALGYAIFRFRLLDVVPVGRATVIEKMRDGFVVLDEHDRIVDLNATARTLAGDDVIGTQATTALPELSQLFESRDPESRTHDDIVVETDDGQRFYTAHLTPLRDDGSLGRLLTIRDVTDNRRIEKRYQALIENASDIITVVDQEGTLAYVSPSVKRILGREPETLRGQSPLEYVHPDDRARVKTAFADIGVDTGTVRFECRVEDADGTVRVVESVGQDLTENPFVQGIVVHTRDVTERHQREQELERANEHLEAFASAISHDLRNPLNVAAGNLELARTEREEAYFQRVESAHERMETLIDDLLRLAKQGQTVAETDQVDLETVATDAWETVETAQATLDIRETDTIDADRNRLRQLFENLYRNAIDHAGEDVHVRVGTRSDGLFVADDGPGIPADQRQAVFQSGYTTSTDGTGFGLAIVRNIVDAHGWSIQAVESESGGARFEINCVEAIAETTAPAAPSGQG